MPSYHDLLKDLRRWHRDRKCLTTWESDWLRTADECDDAIAVLHTRCEVLKFKKPTANQSEQFRYRIERR